MGVLGGLIFYKLLLLKINGGGICVHYIYIT